MTKLADRLRNMPRAEILLHLGEMSAQELRTREEPTEEEKEEAHMRSQAAVRALNLQLRPQQGMKTSEASDIAKQAGEIFRGFALAHFNDKAVRGAIPAAQAPMLADMAVVEFEHALYKALKTSNQQVALDPTQITR